MNRIIITADTTEADLKALTEQFGEGSIKFIKMKIRGRKKGFKLQKDSKSEITDEKKIIKEVIEPKVTEKIIEKKIEAPKPAPVVKKEIVKKKTVKSTPVVKKTEQPKKKGVDYDPYF